jgi:crossover junction endodeoxyribonuclease RuvC
MRLAPTAEEALLWVALRRSQLGAKFRRQVPIGTRFIADFLAFEARLIVEVDGGCHAQKRSADRRRDEKLRRAGFRVLRIDGPRVRRDLPAVLAEIRAELGSRE